MANQSLALDHVFDALGHPARRAIVVRLGAGPAPVAELAKPFRMALPTLLRHLGVLERSGLIRSRKTGRVRTCELRPATLRRAEGWLVEQRLIWEERTDRFARHVETLAAQERNDVR